MKKELNVLKQEIIEVLKESYKISDKELHSVWVLTNNGAKLFYTTNSYTGIFNQSKYISKTEELDKLDDFNTKLIKIFNDTNLSKYCTIDYLLDPINKRVLNIQIGFKNDDEVIKENILEIINNLLQDSTLHLAKGKYYGKTMLQIGTTCKGNAIKKVHELIGIPENSILRIGSRGDIQGNDFSMLDCSQGFSVDKVSGKVDSCFPILNENGDMLKGVEATIFMLSKVKLLPTICLESANQYNYRKQYSFIEKKITESRKFYLETFNKIINKKFNVSDGINGIFDSSSGSIKIPMYEWELISDNNPLKRLWSIGENEKLYYSLRDNESYLLRGSKTYYYFLATRCNTYSERAQKEIDVTTKENVLHWSENHIDFFRLCILAISNTANINSIENKKMLLGILDNIRNYLLVNINYQIIQDFNNQSIFINFERLSKGGSLSNLYKLLVNIDTIIKDICFEFKYSISKNNLIDLLEKSLHIAEVNKINFFSTPELEDYSKYFRAYREIDNFAENYITVMLSSNELNNNHIGVCGLCYGGIELPIIYKIIKSDIEDISILKFSKQVSGYSAKQSLELRFFDIENFGGIDLIGINKDKNYILMDDNLLTGKTMQLAINSMYDLKINVSNLIVVRYPSINRVDQMFLKGHGAIDYKYFFDYIKGLYFPSPYSWRDSNSIDIYKDSLGVFDLNRNKIIECLAKNHDYAPHSEVYKLKRTLNN